MSPSLTSRPFGKLPTGEPVDAYTLIGAGGLSLQVITYGGIITHLHVLDKDGRIDDVVLGFDHLTGYLAGHPYFGAITGRVAGRISRGRLTVEGRTYPLACNHPPNHLHGGLTGLDKRLWIARAVIRPDGSPSLRLTYHSPDGEEGYPGAVDLAVTYTVTETNTLVIDTEAVADRVTPLSLTNHSYFNLAGESGGSIVDHELQIHADAIVATDDHLTLLGKRVPVAGRANDLNQPRRLGDILSHLHQWHGDLYLIPRPSKNADEDNPALVLVAHLSEPHTRRLLTVSTTEHCVQLYTGVALDGAFTGKSGQPYCAHAGLCLECEGYPEGSNNSGFGNILLQPGQPTRHTTRYAFSTY